MRHLFIICSRSIGAAVNQSTREMDDALNKLSLYGLHYKNTTEYRFVVLRANFTELRVNIFLAFWGIKIK